MLSRINKTLIVTSALFLTSPLSSVFAQGREGAVDASRKDFQISEPPDALSNIPELIGWAVQLLFVIAALIAFVYLLLGGIKWITSGGDKGQVETARNQIIQALIGLVVVFAAWGLIVLVEQLLDIGLGFSAPISLPNPDSLKGNPDF